MHANASSSPSLPGMLPFAIARTRVAPLRVLLLDDDALVLGALASVLSGRGVEIVTCREIEAADAILARTRFDVVLLDLQVSELGGFEGLRLAAHVVANYPGTRVVLCSGHSTDPRVVAQARKLGVAAVLSKPVGADVLRATVLGQIASDRRRDFGQVQETEMLDDILDTAAIDAVLQPIVELRDGRPPYTALGVEALCRARAGGVLRNPEILFAYAAKKERLETLETLAVRAALREASGLEGAGRLFINVQPRTLCSPRFVASLPDMVAAGGRAPESVVLELTEHQGTGDPKALLASLQRVRAWGFGIALDDYGAGVSNLHFVQELAPDYLKISGVLTRELATSSVSQVIIGSTVEMAQRLGMATILEAIETGEQLTVARNLGVTFGQGYFLSRPARAAVLAGAGAFPAFALAKAA